MDFQNLELSFRLIEDRRVQLPQLQEALKVLEEKAHPDHMLRILRAWVMMRSQQDLAASMIKAMVNLTQKWRSHVLVELRRETSFKHFLLEDMDLAVLHLLPKEVSFLYFAMASNNYSGFVREQAVRALTQFDDTGRWEILLIRSFDWVGVIQSFALRHFRTQMGKWSARELFKYAAILFNLEKRILNSELSQFKKEVFEKLRSSQDGRYLREELDQKQLSFEEKRFIIRIVRDQFGKDEAWVQWAVRDDDQKIRKIGLEVLSSLKAPLEMFKLYLNDPSPRIRFKVFDYLNNNSYAFTRSEIESLLMDRSDAVRELAQYLTKDWGEFSLRDFYLQRREKNEVAAIFGLVDIGALSLDEVIDYLDFPQTKVRVMALKKLEKLDPVLVLEKATALLESSSSRLRNKAIKLLSMARDTVWDKKILELWRMGTPENQVVAEKILRSRAFLTGLYYQLLSGHYPWFFIQTLVFTRAPLNFKTGAASAQEILGMLRDLENVYRGKSKDLEALIKMVEKEIPR